MAHTERGECTSDCRRFGCPDDEYIDPWLAIDLENRARVNRENAHRAKARSSHNLKLLLLAIVATIAVVSGICEILYRIRW